MTRTSGGAGGGGGGGRGAGGAEAFLLTMYRQMTRGAGGGLGGGGGYTEEGWVFGNAVGAWPVTSVRELVSKFAVLLLEVCIFDFELLDSGFQGGNAIIGARNQDLELH